MKRAAAAVRALVLPLKRCRERLRPLIRRAAYFGFSRKCPLCGGNFRRFLPAGLDLPVLAERRVVGAGPRAEAVCPGCGAMDRERHVYLYLKAKTKIFEGKHRVLHFAPEKSLAKALAASPQTDYRSADLDGSKAMEQMSVTDIRYGADHFDAVICNHVLEHVPDDSKAMSEIFRVLKPGGWAVLQVPISLNLPGTYEDFSVLSFEDREKTFGQGDHVRIYAKDYRERLERAGFSVETHDLSKELGPAAAKRYGLLPDEEIYVASKPGARR